MKIFSDLLPIKLAVAFLFYSLLSYGYSEAYRKKYAAVLEHYQKIDIDQQKFDAALYLIDHMESHQSPEGQGIDLFLSSVRNYKPKTDIGKLGKLWSDCNDNMRINMLPDSSVVSCENLMSNIDDAFSIWRISPWYNDISFDSFCEYILPYRVSNEHFQPSWRKELRECYKNAIENVSDVKAAFTILRRRVLDSISNSNSFTPYNLDVLTYNHIRRANCDQRCILLVSVLRAFAIPAAIDGVPHWADYSTKGHSWVALLLADGTYTVFESEDVPLCNNRIDASNFIKDSTSFEGLSIPFSIKYEKRVAKVFRTGYADIYKDVSVFYGLNGKISIPVANQNKVWLCTFVTGKDWQPIVQEPVKNGIACFENLGNNVVYLPVMEAFGQKSPLSPPILLDKNGDVHYLKSDSDDTCSVVLTRKYPLCSYMPAQWIKLINSIIEGADNPKFTLTDTLAVITATPYGRTSINIRNAEKYRYIRFKSNERDIALLSELLFKDEANKTYNGQYLTSQVDTNRLSLLTDGDKETKIKAFKPGYWIGIDLGEKRNFNLSSIEFAPVSDGNDIQKGHLYELYGFDTQWHLLGRSFAHNDDCLTFYNIPKGMLLLLKDKTKGHEERIFIYKNGKQIWY